MLSVHQGPRPRLWKRIPEPGAGRRVREMKSGQRETRRAEVGDSTSASSSYQLLFSILNCTCCLRSNAPKLDREPGLDSADAHGETAASGCPVERSSTGLYLKAAN